MTTLEQLRVESIRVRSLVREYTDETGLGLDEITARNEGEVISQWFASWVDSEFKRRGLP